MSFPTAPSLPVRCGPGCSIRCCWRCSTRAPAEGSAKLTAAVLKETLLRGGRATMPRIATPSLGAAFVEPALAWLAARGVPVALGRRLRAVVTEGDRVTALDWGSGPETVLPGEAVVLARAAVGRDRAAPWPYRPRQLPRDRQRALRRRASGRRAGDARRARRHRGVAVRVPRPHLGDGQRRRGAGRLRPRGTGAGGSGTTSAAPTASTRRCPRWQVVKEKRATFAATPAQDARRPAASTRWRNLFLAGDWTRTGLPATIEGALRSGETAAGLVLRGSSG